MSVPPADAAVLTVGMLRALARQGTSPAVERALGVLLGAESDVVAAAVDRIVAAGRLAQGLLAPVLVLAARRGADAAGAIAELGSGRPLPEGWSAYELRTAADEAADDLRAALRTPPAGTGAIVAAGFDAPVTVALAIRRGDASAVLCGPVPAHLDDGLALRRAVVDHAMVARMAEAAGWAVHSRALPDGGEDVVALLTSAPDEARVPRARRAGLDEVVVRDPGYLAPL